MSTHLASQEQPSKFTWKFLCMAAHCLQSISTSHSGLHTHVLVGGRLHKCSVHEECGRPMSSRLRGDLYSPDSQEDLHRYRSCIGCVLIVYIPEHETGCTLVFTDIPTEDL